MRSIILGAACIAAVGIGAALVRSSNPWVLLTLVVGAAGVMSWALAAHAVRSEHGMWALGGLLVCAGLLRGASLAPPVEPRIPERGAGDPSRLREFEVVGASEPGPSCRVAARTPGHGGPELELELPAEDCPLAAGERVALLSAPLGQRWYRELLGREAIVLGRGPVLWRRPTPPPRLHAQLARRYWEQIAALRQRAWASTRGDLRASLVVAAGLGLRSALAPEARARLRAAGLGHLIAVSGLHVAVAALWLLVAARRAATLFGVPLRWASALAFLPLWAYVGLTGGAASAVRAAAMLTAIELGVVVGRPAHGPTTLVLVAAAMLLWHPSWLLDPGFALSMSAMAAIVTAPRELGMLAMSWRITWATAPLSVVWFDAAPLHGILANAIALPVFAWMMPAALVASLAPGRLGVLAMDFAKLFAGPILDLAELLARLPSLGPSALLVLAATILIARRLAEARRPPSRSSPAPGSGSRSSAWWPPRFACWLTVVVGAGLTVMPLRSPPPSDSFAWVALGSSRSYSLLVADTEHPALACLYRPTGGAATWRSVLELLGLRGLSQLDAALPPDPAAPELEPDAAPRRPRHDPRSRALARELERAGFTINAEPSEPAPGCSPPPRAELRALLRDCQYLQGGRGRVFVRVDEHGRSCRVDARWVELPPGS